MFTGIISALGQIRAVQALGATTMHGKQLEIGCPEPFAVGVALGDSIALNGACMTVTRIEPQTARFWVDISHESLTLTAGLDQPGAVNLEKALRAHDRLDGHLVSGHVDGIGRVTRLEPVGESWELRLLCPAALARYLALKGSITVNGVSLTVNQVTDTAEGCAISINLVPHTVQHTTLGLLRCGSLVNLEIDLIARYVERMLGLAGSAPTSATGAAPLVAQPQGVLA